MAATVTRDRPAVLRGGSPQILEPGEALYRSSARFSGYYRDEPATRDALRDGWFHSGDMCRHGDDGLRVMVDELPTTVGGKILEYRLRAQLVGEPVPE